MADELNISPAGWGLLEMLQQQSGVSLEVVHLWLHPARQVAPGESARAIEEPGVAEQVLRAARTGEVRLDHAGNLAFGVFPLRRAREVVACLIASRRASGEAIVASPADARQVEEVGALARAALESDLALSGQVAAAQALTRRLQGILRFLGQLGTYESDREMMHAVLHAATVWFDLDCRIYQRQADGSFSLAGALPRVEPPAGERLEAARVAQLVAARRLSTAGDLDDLGLGGRRDEVLVLPVGGARPDWIILLAGGVDTNAELTFSAIARVLTGELQARELARIARWQQELASIPADVQRAPERAVLRLLEALIQETGAQSGRVTLADGGGRRTIAAVGQPAVPAAPEHPERKEVEAAPPARPGELAVQFSIASDVSVMLELGAPTPLNPSAATIVDAWIKALRPWLGEILTGLTREEARFDSALEATSFERRIQEEIERAKRFNLGLGLILIGPGRGMLPASWSALEPFAAAVRPELRASDLLGRIRGGLVAAVLVHAGPEGAESVTSRLKQRLAELPVRTPVSSLHLGQAVFSAECTSAQDLIAKALRQAQELSLRH